MTDTREQELLDHIAELEAENASLRARSVWCICCGSCLSVHQATQKNTQRFTKGSPAYCEIHCA